MDFVSAFCIVSDSVFVFLMSNFVASPLEVPALFASMKGLQTLLDQASFHVGSVGFISPSTSHKELKLTHVGKPVQIEFSILSDDFSSKNVVLDTTKIEETLVKLLKSAASDFDVIAQALAASLEIHIGDLLNFDKATYIGLINGSLDQLKRTGLYPTERESKPCPIYVAPFENDFLLVVMRVLKAFADGRSVTILCSSLRLMIPLFVFTKQVLSAGSMEALLSFIPIEKPSCDIRPSSSIQMVMRPADLECATRAIIKATTYHAGVSSWRPAVVLVEQNYETAFHDKVKKIVSEATGHGDVLNENSHLHNSCVLPSYLRSEFEEFVKSASVEGAEVIRPQEGDGPVLLFGLTPASAAIEKFKFLPVGPYTVVLPFRTLNEGLKLSKYFADREKRILGAGEYVCSAPKSAIVWTDSASLSLQVLAKLVGYTTLGVNCDTYRLAASYYLSECSAPRPTAKFLGLPVPKNESFNDVNVSVSADLMKCITSTDGLYQTWRKMSIDRRLSAFTDWKELTPIMPTVDRLRTDCASALRASHLHETLSEQLNSAFSSRRLCLLKKWQEPVGALAVVLKACELLPNLQYLVLSSVVLGSPVILIAPQGTRTLSSEVMQFCKDINEHVAKCCPCIGKLGPMVQLKQVDASAEAISAALASLPVNGTYCLSVPEDSLTTSELSVEELCKITSVFWSVGDDLFAN